MECIVRPFKSWDEWPDNTKAFFQAQRSPAGEEVILEKNLFIEYLLPLRGISKEAMDVYRSYWEIPGPSRMPMLAWSRDLPIAGEPKDVVEVVDSYARWMSTNTIPKLFIDAEPAGFLIKGQREFCRAWPNQEKVTVKGAAFSSRRLSKRSGRGGRQVRSEGPCRADRARTAENGKSGLSVLGG